LRKHERFFRLKMNGLSSIMVRMNDSKFVTKGSLSLYEKKLGLYDDHTYEHCNSNFIKYIEMNKIDVFIYIFL